VTGFTRGLSAVGHRLFALFRDPPSWAEFTSAVGITAYGLSFFLPWGRAPEDWHSLSLLTDLLPAWWWPAITMLGGLGQFTGLYLNQRFLRASAAAGAVLWTTFQMAMVWPIYPASPLLIQNGAMLILVNMLVVAHHSRDWRR
jgi:hypothetical protein